MAIIDLSTPVGALRLRLGDTRDLPMLDDCVYEQALLDTNGNLKAATILCGQYILAQLAFKTHQKMGLLEVWGAESFKNYMTYLMLVIKDPNFTSISPIPFSLASACPSPIDRFQKNWYDQYDCSCYESVEYTSCGGCP